MNRMDMWLTDAPSTHDREVPVECDNCRAVFDVTLARNEEFSDLRPDERPICCEEPDMAVMV